MAQAQVKYTASEYLALEREAVEKHEFLDGQIYAMAGASVRHNRITLNIGGELRAALRGSRCEAFPSDLRVRVSATGLYTYPDISVVCGEPEFEDDGVETLLNPTVLVEVLSPSTADYDRGAKFEHYRALPSMREYLLVDQHRAHVMHYRRQDEGTWLLAETRDLDDAIRLPSLDIELKMSEIYARVEFSAGQRAPRRAEPAVRPHIFE